MWRSWRCHTHLTRSGAPFIRARRRPVRAYFSNGLSCPAKAGHPAITTLRTIRAIAITGSPAFAGDDGCGLRRQRSARRRVRFLKHPGHRGVGIELLQSGIDLAGEHADAMHGVVVFEEA